jgi:hypothetical protein
MHIVPKPDRIAILPTPQGKNIEQKSSHLLQCKRDLLKSVIPKPKFDMFDEFLHISSHEF